MAARPPATALEKASTTWRTEAAVIGRTHEIKGQAIAAQVGVERAEVCVVWLMLSTSSLRVRTVAPARYSVQKYHRQS